MNTLLSIALSAAALLPAAPPVALGPVRPNEEQLLKGKILVLANGRTVEGDIERIGERYRVCRPVGETWIEGNQDTRLCASPEEVYDVLRVRLKPHDADGRARLAEWCLEHALPRQARVEVEAILIVNEHHLQARRLLARLELSDSPVAPQTVAPPALPTPPPSPRLDLTSEALNQFATRIQPILMNACVSCHNEARGATFRLTRSYEIGVANRSTLRQNVAAVLAYVNVNQPQASPFLTKAMTAHWCQWTPQGMVFKSGDPSQPAIQNRNAPAYRALEEWVHLALSTSPQLADLQAAVTPPPSAPAPEPRTIPVTPVETVAPGSETTTRRVETTPSVPAAAQTAAPAPGPAVPDAYDPDEFNRRNHPDRVK